MTAFWKEAGMLSVSHAGRIVIHSASCGVNSVVKQCGPTIPREAHVMHCSPPAFSVCLSVCLFVACPSMESEKIRCVENSKFTKWLLAPRVTRHARLSHASDKQVDCRLMSSVCLSLCVLATLRKNYLSDLYENFY